MGENPPVIDVSTQAQAPTAPAVPASDVTSAGLLAEVTRERKARQALEAEVADLRKLRDDHSNLSATHSSFVEQMRTHNARRIESLPEHARGIISALPPTSTEVDIARALDALAPILAAVAAPAASAATATTTSSSCSAAPRVTSLDAMAAHLAPFLGPGLAALMLQPGPPLFHQAGAQRREHMSQHVPHARLAFALPKRART